MRTVNLWAGACAAAILVSGCGGESAPPPASQATSANPVTPINIAVSSPVASKPSTPATAAKATASATRIDDRAEAMHFLTRLTFGPNQIELNNAVGKDAAQLLRAEFDVPRRPHLARVINTYKSRTDNRRYNSYRTHHWKNMIEGPDQLRQRMVFALSQIVVVSDRKMQNQPTQVAYYTEILNQNAFGNYRNLLRDITYSPAMGEYLTYLGNRKGDPSRGRLPDENYAREIMQLFSIGLVELNMDGTPKRDAQGNTIPTYDNDDVVGLARVFTGLDLPPVSDRDLTGFNEELSVRRASPMIVNASEHSPLEKSFLGKTIPAGTSAQDSIERTMGILVNHPNTPPFVSRQLIQRFTASDPDPAYVERVARVFASGTYTSSTGVRFGKGYRGDLEATLAAILLDESQHRSDTTVRTSTDLGKVREPVLNFVHWARLFKLSRINPEMEFILSGGTGNPDRLLGQQALSAPSVFNFYRPGYVPVGTESGDRGVTVPEFQLLLAGNRAGYINMMTEYVFDYSIGDGNQARSKTSFFPDYDEVLARVEDPERMIRHLDDLLLGGRMSEQTKRTLRDGMTAIPIRTTQPANAELDRYSRAVYAVLAVVISPEYMVQ